MNDIRGNVPEPLSLPAELGKYRLLREIGRGGAGVVYEARDLGLGRSVALKMLRPGRDLSPDELAVDEERFLREARLAAKLPKHPNVVGVYEAGRAAGRLYLAMEYVAGATLWAWREKQAPSLRQQVSLLREAAAGVEHAHLHGIIHRDIKPSNILIDAENHPHVADFGLAKQVRRDSGLSLTDQGMTVGTPTYMSPEQVEGRKNLDARADVWALGVILYEMMCGRPPFRSESGIDLMVKIAKDPVPAPSSVIPKGPHAAIDPALENICLKALAKERGERYPSALALADDLGRWLHREEVTAPPATSRVTVGQRRRRRLRAILVGAAALALGATTLLVVVLGRDPSDPPQAAASAKGGQCREYVREGKALLASGQPEEAYEKFYRAGKEDPGAREPEDGKREALAELARRTVSPRSTAGPAKAATVVPASPAEEAMRKAYAVARASPNDFEGQLKAWREALKASRGTARAEEAAGEVEATLARGRESLRRELAALDETIRVFETSELYGPLDERLAELARRHEDTDWEHSIAERRAALAEDVRRLMARLREQAAQAKASGDSALAEELRRRVRFWRWPGLLEEIDQTLGVKTDPSPENPTTPAPEPKPTPEPAAPPAPTPIPAPASARNARLVPLEPGATHENGVTSVAFSADGRWLLSGGHDSTVRLWDIAQRKEARSLELPTDAFAVAVSPDGRWIAASGKSHVRLWDTAKFQSRSLEKHGGGVTRILFSNDSRTLATSGWDGMVYFWDVATASLLPGIDFYHPEGAPGMDFSPNGKYLAVVAGDGSLRLWELATRKNRVLVEATGIRLVSASFSPDGKWIATAGDGPNIILLDPISGRSKSIPTGSEAGTAAVLFAPDGRILAAAGTDGNIRIWDVATGELRLTLEVGGRCMAAAFSRKGDLFASGGDQWRTRLWDASSLGILKKSK